MTTPLQPKDALLHGIDVWFWATESLDETQVGSLLSVLAPSERARAGRFAFARDRRDYVAAHALLRHVLSRHGPRGAHEWQFAADAHGKPALVAAHAGDPRIAFNLSHTRGLVACAVALETRVGIDVEPVEGRRDAPAIARAHFAPAEVALIESAPAEEQAARFAELWTLKEAFLKGVGTGLRTRALDSFAFAFDDRAGLRCEVEAEREVPALLSWQFALTAPTPGYRMAVAIELPLVAAPWTLTVSAVGSGDEVELLRSSGPLTFGCAQGPASLLSLPTADPKD